jgi:endonuclease/exonuclease/phosphatase family metal-dependent hydrolase
MITRYLNRQRAGIVIRSHFISIILGVVTLLSVSAFGADHVPDLKVMSFNIRFGAANDGNNSWEFRKELVADTIEHSSPDLLGLQEALKFQVDYIQEHFPEMSMHGVGRDEGKEKGEYCAIFFNKKRFNLVDAGHYWLSKTPNVPGSTDWDTALTRMVSWVVLEDRMNDNKPFIYANTHFDHVGRVAREESAKLIRSKYENEANGLPGILTGDFNAAEGSAPYKALIEGDSSSSAPMFDTFRQVNPEPTNADGSFGGWAGRRSGARIDWIVTTKHFDALNASINHTNLQGRYPSDHYPVEAVVRLK